MVYMSTDPTVGMGTQSQERALFLRMAELLGIGDAPAIYASLENVGMDGEFVLVSRESVAEIAPEVEAVVARLRGGAS